MPTRPSLSRLALLPLILVALSAASATQAAYLAQAVTEKDGTRPLPESLDPILNGHPQELLQLEWSEYSGPKARVAVMETDNQAGNTYKTEVRGPDGQAWSYSYNVGRDYEQVPVNGIEAIVSDVLFQTGRFRVVERDQINQILDEQDLGASGRVSQPSAAKVGKILGAEYQVQVVVNSYEPEVKKKKGGLGAFARKVPLVGGIKWENATSKVVMTFKMWDAETSELVHSKIIEVTMKKRDIGFGGVGWGSAGALGGFMGDYSKTPIGQAVIAAVNAGVYELVKRVGGKPAEGQVAAVSGARVILNLGEGSVGVGDLLRAVAVGEEIVDPSTGLVIDRNEQTLGELRVVEVKEKASYAEPVGFAADKLKAGDKVVSTAKPQTYEFGPAW